MKIHLTQIHLMGQKRSLFKEKTGAETSKKWIISSQMGPHQTV
jgi:hypothetical protein